MRVVLAERFMNAPDRIHSVKPTFRWDDPLLLDEQLTEEERMVRETAHAYAQEKLLPRITQAFRHESTDPAIFTEFAGASSGLLGDADLETAAEAIEPGSAAVIIVYENRWAAPFAAAVRRNGGVMVASERIPVQDLLEALDAAEAAA